MSITAILAFLGSPLGRLAGVGLLGLALYGTGFARGTMQANARHEAAQLRAEIAAKARDQKQTEIAADDDAARVQGVNDQSTETRRLIREYQDELAKRSAAVCRLDAGDLERLRVVVGAAGSGEAAAGAADHDSGEDAATGRDAKAVVADYVGALRECNARLLGAAEWYRGVRKRYGSSPLR